MQKMSEEIEKQIARDISIAGDMLQRWDYRFGTKMCINVGDLINELTSVIRLLTCSRSVLEDTDGGLLRHDDNIPGVTND